MDGQGDTIATGTPDHETKPRPGWRRANGNTGSARHDTIIRQHNRIMHPKLLRRNRRKLAVGKPAIRTVRCDVWRAGLRLRPAGCAEAQSEDGDE